MSKYLFAFHGGKMPDTPADIERIMASWGQWMETLGPALIEPGSVVGKNHTVSPSGVVENGGNDPLTGYLLIQAESIAAASDVAKSCPILENGGTIEVAELMEMDS